MNESNAGRESAYTYCHQTDISDASAEMIELGKEIVKELGVDQSTDTLSRWMAHYLAEQMKRVRDADAEVRADAEKQCFHTILALWKHRSALPDGSRPFEELEPIIRAIQSLDPDSNIPRYPRIFGASPENPETEPEATSWLDIASHLDEAARVLIGYCLGEASRSARNRAQEWVALAEQAELDSEVPKVVLRFVTEASADGDSGDVADPDRELLIDRRDRLQAFVQVANTVIDDLNGRLHEES